MQIARWVGASVGSVALTAICIAYVDHPVARLTLKLEAFHHFLWQVPVTAPVFSALAGSAIVLALLVYLTGRRQAPWMTPAAIAGVASILAGALVKYALKPMFGRTPTGSFLRGREDVFHWFDAGQYSISFPSTHAAQAAAAFAVLSICYPRWRWSCVAAQLVLASLLVAGRFHFLGDVVAGTYAGVVVGAATIAVWEGVSARWRASDPNERKSSMPGA